ncbi:hypothetical protein [Streptomyces sioyaensis]|uniref:hypothetical protein n=1 Tax=Streptomyces sioyaensis TaxID=67364 RepID=UPI003713319C
MTDRDQGEPAADDLGAPAAGRHRRNGPVLRPPHSIRTREPRRTAGPRRVALLIPAAALLVLAGGVLGSFSWMLVPSYVLCLAGGIWLLGAANRLLPGGGLNQLMMTLLAGAALATAVLAADASHGFVLETRGEVRSGQVARVVEHHGKTTSYECFLRYRGATKAPGSLNCGESDRVGDTVHVAWDPGGLVEPDFAEAKGTYRFFAVLAMMSEIALVFLGEFTVVLGVVMRTAHRGSAARGPGTADGPESAGDR